uniref:Agglutinin domain-containing protein n=1 Tax=Opuntia streptacantha TaxID=393608 RepID=A0A7C9F1N6_OPUST
MSSLPNYAVLQSCLTNNYMDLILDEGPNLGYIPFTGDSVLSPYAKIAFEKSEIAPGCVHIRCCYNNKYWTRKSPESGSPIVAGAEEAKPKEENKEKDSGMDGGKADWDCTLFKVEKHSNGIISIRHIGTGDVLRVEGPKDEGELGDSHSPEEAGCLVGAKSIGGLSQTQIALTGEDAPTFAATYLPIYFKVINLSSLVVLPRYVAFKGDNNNFLQARTIERHPYLQFSSHDSRNAACQMEVFQNPDGTIRIKSKHFGRFWRRSPNWIWADSDDTSNNRDTRFKPVKVGSHKIALRNLGNNRFCSRLTTEGKTSCLNADSTTAREEATLEVKELVLSREIDNVKYRLQDATIYDNSVVLMATSTTTNSTNQTTSHTFKFTYKDTTTTMWQASVSAGLSVEFTFKGGVPLLADGEIKISAEISSIYEWGKVIEDTKELESTEQISVPPMTEVTCKLLASTGKFGVPFSYTQHDILIDGTEVTYPERDDGVFSGGKTYDVHLELTEKPIKK